MDVLILEKFINMFNSLESINAPKIDVKFTDWKESEFHHIKTPKSVTEDNTLDSEDTDDDD